MKKPPAYGKEVLLQCSHTRQEKGKAGHILTSAGDSASEVERCLHC